MTSALTAHRAVVASDVARAVRGDGLTVDAVVTTDVVTVYANGEPNRSALVALSDADQPHEPGWHFGDTFAIVSFHRNGTQVVVRWDLRCLDCNRPGGAPTDPCCPSYAFLHPVGGAA